MTFVMCLSNRHGQLSQLSMFVTCLSNVLQDRHLNHPRHLMLFVTCCSACGVSLHWIIASKSDSQKHAPPHNTFRDKPHPASVVPP